jgi:vacuolar-type H+-ATPase subunit I/STV1
MEPPKRTKKSKPTLIQKPSTPPMQKQLTEEEKVKISQQKQLESIRFYLEQETKKKIHAKTNDAKDLQHLLKEYLSAYILIGFDVIGEELTIRTSETTVLHRALDDLFRSQMIKFQIKKSGEFQDFG